MARNLNVNIYLLEIQFGPRSKKRYVFLTNPIKVTLLAPNKLSDIININCPACMCRSTEPVCSENLGGALCPALGFSRLMAIES